MATTVAIVEDDAGVRDGLVRLLGRAKDIRCVGGYPSAEAALRELPAAPPNIVLMDINLPGMNGIECVRRLKVEAPSIQILMLTVYENAEQIFEALTAGATGYLLKQTPPAELLAALREVHRGGAPMSSQIARKVVQSFQTGIPAGQQAELSPREREILERLARGDLIKHIADQLGSSFDTVRTHLRRIYEKLHVHSRAQAVAQYLHPASPRRPQAGPAMDDGRRV
jgi:DNA-binding NarL/FixJ family response regulator